MGRQTDTLGKLAPGSRVAVIRLRSLGDCVLSTPAIHLLRHARPDLEIGVVVEDRFASLFDNHPDVDRVIPPAARAIRAFAPALCLNLHGGSRSARLTLLSGAPIRAGFDIFRPVWIYNAPIPTAQETLGVSRRVHTAEHAASAVFHLGVPISEIPRACICAAPGRSRFAPEGPYAAIHPFAASPAKTWPASSFAESARESGRWTGLEPVFIAGPGEDLSAFGSWRTVSGASLAEVAQLLRDATLFIGNDSGPAHLAAAFAVPQVVLFGPSDAEVWAPWRTPSVVIRAEGPIDAVPVAQVLDAIEQLWARSWRRASNRGARVKGGPA